MSLWPNHEQLLLEGGINSFELIHYIFALIAFATAIAAIWLAWLIWKELTHYD